MSRYVLVLLILVAGVALAGGMYKWVDEDGRTVYSDTPPPGKAVKQVELPPQPPKEVLEEAQQALERQRALRGTSQQVLGTFALGFAPTVLATLPQPPIGLTLVVRPTIGTGEFKFRITDPSPRWTVKDGKTEGNSASSEQNFSFSLKPGTYEIAFIEAEAPSLSATPFSLLTGSPRFTVPEGNCVYVGRIGMAYMRLPPGSMAQARAAVTMMAKEMGKPLLLIYLPKGTLVPVANSVDIPGDTESRQGVGGGIKGYAEARANNCSVQLAKF